MELLVVIVVLVLFEVAALRWGVDSRTIGRGYPGAGGLLPQAGSSKAGSGSTRPRQPRGEE